MSVRVHMTRVSLSFPKVGAVLRDLQGTLEKGRAVAILGPSGSGKSSILRLLAGLLEPTGGRVDFEGSGIRVGMIFQGANLLPWKTALQNVAFAYELTHPGSSGARIRAQEWLSRVGISEDAWQSYPHELSGGMAMRVAIARALIVEPGLLLSDEPFGALDESLRERLQSDLREFHTATSMTHVLVTHSVSEAVWMSDEVWILGGAPATFLRKSEVALERIRKPELRWSSEFHGEVRRIRELTQEAALEKSG